MTYKPTGETCVVEGCDAPAVSVKRGWCVKHQRRWERHRKLTSRYNEYGERLRWLQEHHLNGDECVEWPWDHGSRYGHVWIDGRQHRVNMVVCEWVHGSRPSPSHQAAHDCGRSRCVNGRHIRWKTPKENQADRVLHGTARGWKR